MTASEGYATGQDRDHVIELMWPGINTDEVDG